MLAVVYLIFNAGYLASSGADLVRVDLCDEGVRLAGLLVDLLPDEPEPLGLAALLLFQDSRRAARSDDRGGRSPSRNRTADGGTPVRWRRAGTCSPAPSGWTGRARIS